MLYPEPSLDYVLSCLRADLHNLMGSVKKRYAPSDFSLIPKPPAPKQSGSSMKAAWAAFAGAFKAKPKKGIGT